MDETFRVERVVWKVITANHKLISREQEAAALAGHYCTWEKYTKTELIVTKDPSTIWLWFCHEVWPQWYYTWWCCLLFFGKTTTPAAFSHVTVFFRQNPFMMFSCYIGEGAYNNDDVHISNAVTTPWAVRDVNHFNTALSRILWWCTLLLLLNSVVLDACLVVTTASQKRDRRPPLQ